MGELTGAALLLRRGCLIFCCATRTDSTAESVLGIQKCADAVALTVAMGKHSGRSAWRSGEQLSTEANKIRNKIKVRIKE
jgi:hypothetical protein